MRVLIVGLGNQGRKRRTVAGGDVVATVDPVADCADYRTVHDVPPDLYDAALVCTPDDAKLATLRYLLGNGVHVLVEKPLLASSSAELRDLAALARSTGAVCYTAYNHRFEPHIVRLRDLLASGRLGPLYVARFHYGNGTARDVRQSPWRDQGLGVLADLGSHVLDMVRFVLDNVPGPLELWQGRRVENRSYDSCLLGGAGKPALEISLSLLSWRNTFTVDIIGAKGSVHIDGLCKWGPSRFTVRDRILPSGKPTEETITLEMPDPTWAAEYAHFQALCAAKTRGRESCASSPPHPSPPPQGGREPDVAFGDGGGLGEPNRVSGRPKQGSLSGRLRGSARHLMGCAILDMCEPEPISGGAQGLPPPTGGEGWGGGAKRPAPTANPLDPCSLDNDIWINDTLAALGRQGAHAEAA